LGHAISQRSRKGTSEDFGTAITAKPKCLLC
jgi:hypothetical protein